MKNRTWTIVLDKELFLSYITEKGIRLDGEGYFKDEDTPYILALHDKVYCRQGWDADRMKHNYQDCEFVHFSKICQSPFDSDPKYINQEEITKFTKEISKLCSSVKST